MNLKIWFTFSTVDVAVCTEFFAPDHHMIQSEQKPFKVILKGQGHLKIKNVA